MTKTDYKTFKEWFVSEFTKEEMNDISSHGADGGFSGITYTAECVFLHDKYESELWEMLYDDAKEFGYDNIPAFMATWVRKDMLNDLDQMKNLIVWYAVEKLSNEADAE